MPKCDAVLKILELCFLIATLSIKKENLKPAWKLSVKKILARS